MFEKILVATNGSEDSLKVAKYAKEILNTWSTIKVLDAAYVDNSRDAKENVLHQNDPFEIEKARMNRIHQVKQQFKEVGIDIALHILHGEPSHTLTEFIKENNYDCIIIGSRGLNKFESFLIGSVSHKIVKNAPCHVLVVK